MRIAWSTVCGPLAQLPPGFQPLEDVNKLLAIIDRLKAEITANRREIAELRERLQSAETDNLGLCQRKRGRMSFQGVELTQADMSVRRKLWEFIAYVVWPHNKELTAGDFEYTPDVENSLCHMILKKVGTLPVGNDEHYYTVKIAAMANTKMTHLRSNAPKKLVVTYRCKQMKYLIIV